MVQSYLKHGPTQAFGVICSSSSNSVLQDKLAYVPALEDVLVWDVKKGQMVAMWHETGHRAEVTCILQSPNKGVFAVGYADGSVRLWSASTESVIATFNGHKRAISALAFGAQGTRLATGSQDTDIIIWDVVAEAGLFRLRGHRDQITSIRFVDPPGALPSTSTSPAISFLLTSAKDTFLKVWDLSTQHCIQTVVAHRSEVWAMDLDPQNDILLTGSGEGELKAWRIDIEVLVGGPAESETKQMSKIIHPISDLPLVSHRRVSQISFHLTEPFLAVQSHDRSVEIFRIRTEEEVKKKKLRRKKRSKEKENDHNKDIAVELAEDDIKLVDIFTPYLIVPASGKIRSFDFGLREDLGSKGGWQILMALASNALEAYHIPKPSKTKETQSATRLYSVDLPGHRTDVRTLSLSSDDALLSSASNGSLKVWNMKTNGCIRTMECGYAICSTFLPGDRHIAVGTKSGDLLLYDLSSSALIETVPAHSGTIWGIHVSPDERNLVTGSADKDIKFWEIERKSGNGENVRDQSISITLASAFPYEKSQNGSAVSFVHVRTLKMTDEVLSVRYSPNGKLLAVSLLDSTVKVFYQDTLKFFLSLYGHKLPVLSLDISSDSKLIVTCSADKNVKIWGLDFGDCHKSIFAHDESVMQVAFEHGSHYFWSVSKDKMLKYWDGDKFENIQKLDGHHGEIWALALSHNGKFAVTGSHDKSIRVWEKLDEPLFLEEERERELEQLYDSGIADTMNHTDGVDGTGPEATAVSKQTTETLMAGEKIMEAIDLADSEREAFREYEEGKNGLSSADAIKLQPPPRNPVLAAYDLEPEAYVLRVVERVQNTALHDAMLVLPFTKVLSLMNYLSMWAQKGWNITLVSHIIFFLLKIHHRQIVGNRIMRTALIPLRKHLRHALLRQKEMIGYNLAALQYIRRRNEGDRIAQFYEEGMDEEKVRARIAEGKKRKRVRVEA